MFTGIVSDKGRVVRLERRGAKALLHLETKEAEDVRVGDSVAVNGVCLTATDVGSGAATFEVMGATLERTNLGALSAGDAVNVELALTAGGRLGRHMVSGHIDGVGTIRRVTRGAGETVIEISCGKELLTEMAERGSVAVDGVSLTVAALSDETFSVNLVTHTLQATTLGDRRVGDTVNIETDILAKYVRRLLESRAGAGRIDEDFLREHGFI